MYKIELTNQKNLLLVILAIVLFSACKVTQPSTSALPDWKLYEQSISDAMSPDSSKICNKLVEINDENTNLVWKEIDGDKYLLVVTWKQNISYYQPYLDSSFYNTGNYPIWITTAPELANRMKSEKYSDVNMRLKQLLGLPPNAEYSYFVEFWVKPSDLFRPCPDAAINDNSCELCFPENASENHTGYINENRISRYYPCDLYNKYPWTQLGYTYDWNPENANHVGLSEFVIKTDANIAVKAIYTTEEYLGKNNN